MKQTFWGIQFEESIRKDLPPGFEIKSGKYGMNSVPCCTTSSELISAAEPQFPHLQRPLVSGRIETASGAGVLAAERDGVAGSPEHS